MNRRLFGLKTADDARTSARLHEPIHSLGLVVRDHLFVGGAEGDFLRVAPSSACEGWKSVVSLGVSHLPTPRGR